VRPADGPTAAGPEPHGAFVCPLCGRSSANPRDLAERYCGGCHRFVDDGVPDDPVAGPPGPLTAPQPAREAT